MKPLCLIPWTSIAINPLGNISPCCKFTDKDEYNITRDTIKEYTDSKFLSDIKNTMMQGKWPDGCIRCKTEEDNNIKSKRQLDYERWQHEFDNYTDDQGYIIASIAFGNTCNLKCIMCSSESSSRWRKEYSDLYGVDIKPVEVISADANEIYDAMPNVIHFDIPGGEPLLSEVEKQKTLLQRYIDSGQSKDITLHYTTNAQLFPTDEWWNIWSHFKEIDMQLSIDGVGKRYEYVRFPAKQKVIEKHVQLYKEKESNLTNFRLSISHTISAYNIFYLTEFFDWCQLYKLPRPWCGVVSDPNHMRPTVYPKQIKEKIVKHLLTSRHEDVHTWANYLLQYDHSEYYEMFLSKTKAHDLYRNLNFSDTFSQVQELIDGVQ